jgi:hypothetical protein
VAAFARQPDDATREIEERERRRFRPFIWIVTEDGAHSFLTSIAELELKVLRLPPAASTLVPMMWSADLGQRSHWPVTRRRRYFAVLAVATPDHSER